VIRIGSVVTETEIDPNWQMYPGESGVIVARADKEMGFSPGEGGFGRFWMVRWSDGDFVQQDTELMVVK
jgi:hypothetical protein